ncbi:MAG TPA: TetR/AcrR family transcriptional regulator [Streptosporangiaceae bacterium]
MSSAEAGPAATAASKAATTAVRRERLNRDRVLRAAVALADESGIAAVSMRGLAKELGVVPMALYKHVADKDELLDGMVDVIIGEFAQADPAQADPAHADSAQADPSHADPSEHWKDRIRQRILAARRTVLRHPWARQAIESRTDRTPAVLGYQDSLAGEFLAGGFSADLTHHVMHAIGNRIWGFSPELFDETQPGQPQDQQSPDPQALAAMAQEFAARYPNILAIALAATDGDLSGVGAGCDEQFEFEFALDLLLDGAERLHHQGWQSRKLVVNANKSKAD